MNILKKTAVFLYDYITFLISFLLNLLEKSIQLALVITTLSILQSIKLFRT